MTRITKDTTIGEALQIDAGIIPILMGIGMHCVGCPSSAGETLEEAAMVHGICLLYTSPSPRDGLLSRMPSSA